MFTYRDFCESVARRAMGMISDSFGSHSEENFKDGEQIVTEVDVAINRMVIDEVKKAYPDHDVRGEEESSFDNESDFVWICDPIDGTIPFSLAIPTPTFSLALVKDGRPVAGVAAHPFSDSVYYAEAGKGAWCGKKRLSVQSERRRDSVGVVSWSTAPKALSGLYTEVSNEGYGIYDLASTVYMGMLVADGRFVGLVFCGDTVHDVAAYDLIVIEAGGIVTDFEGNLIEYGAKMDGCISAHPDVHPKLLACVQRLRNA